MSDKLIFSGRNRVRYDYARFGYTRGGGKTWHGGVDVEGLDSDVIRMPYYFDTNGNAKPITGKVVTARIVTNKSNLTWQWGYYVCVKLDDNQTPDAVNYLYFCHCAKLLVAAGTKVISGQDLAVMGNTGNAALADPPYKHLHFEVRATATSKGLDPTAYLGFGNAVGTYGTEPDKIPTATVLVSGLRLRTLPSTSGGLTVGVLERGGIYPVTQTQSDWVYLRTGDLGGGWACCAGADGTKYLEV